MRVIRGGSFSSDVSWLRLASCDHYAASARDEAYGFRVARTLGTSSGTFNVIPPPTPLDAIDLPDFE